MPDSVDSTCRHRRQTAELACRRWCGRHGKAHGLPRLGLAELDWRWEDLAVDALVQKLDARLREWTPETAAEVRASVTEVMELADQDVLDLMRPRATEQEVLDLLDEPTTR